MKKTYHPLLISLLALILTYCSNDDAPQKEEYPVPIKLEISANKIEPFQKLDVKYQMTDEELLASYDRIVWKYDAEWDDGIYIISPSTNPYDSYRNREITDHRIGFHKVAVAGYKEDKLVSTDTIEFEVIKPTGDFLSQKWTDKIEGYLGCRTTILPHFDMQNIENRSFIRLAIWPNESEYGMYTILDYTPHYSNPKKIEWEIERENIRKESQFTRELWHDYLTQIYGKSSLVYEGENDKETTLWEEYSKRFKNPLNKIYPWSNDNYPVEIWDISSAYICLFSTNGGWYYVIAEPRY